MTQFLRPKSGFRYDFAGVNTNNPPDSLPPTKSPMAQNVRSLMGQSVVTRPGQTQRFTTAASAITDLRAYARLSTDDLPRILCRNAADAIYLDTGALVGTLSGGGASPGATLIPFRPNASPVPYMYIANGTDYQKFSAPTAGGVVTAARAGIAEPQSPPDACPDQFYWTGFDAIAAGWTAAGTAGAPADITRSTENIVRETVDPASFPTDLPVAVPANPRVSIQVGTTQQYQIGQHVVLAGGGGNIPAILLDVISPTAFVGNFTITAVRYFSGTTGRCVIVTTIIGPGFGAAELAASGPSAASLLQQSLISSFRRGALMSITGGVAETVLILSAVVGPDGSLAIETSTTNTHAAGEAVAIVPTLVADAPTNRTGSVISSVGVSSAIAAGSGTLTQAPFPTVFTDTFLGYGDGIAVHTAVSVRTEDYVHFSINVDDITKLATTGPAIRLMFDVNNGAANFTDNYYYFDVQPSDLAAAVAGTQTQLGATQLAIQRIGVRNTVSFISSGEAAPVIDTGSNSPDVFDFGAAGDTTSLGASQWTEIMFPISSLTRVGNDQTRTLANTQAVQLQIVCTANITVKISSFWVGGGGQPDSGGQLNEYFYRVRPRSAVTGVIGNPSPTTRYGVFPRRQPVVVPLPSAAYDSQIDTWDVFRFGGTVTSWRYIGSIASSSSTFKDNQFDDAASAGDALEFDNFEPWPSIDLPQSLTATSLAGTLMVVTIPAPTNALRWLPGTRIILNNSSVFTLYARPTLISGTSYLLQLSENSGPGTNTAIQIPEPVLARQPMPYMFGPDAAGRVLACGDLLRPGTLYFTKSNNPDSAPDSYNRELIPPSEPLIGGEVIDGLAFVSTPERWFALYPQQSLNPTQFYNPVQVPVPRGSIAPWGSCNDGKEFYFWAKDGIWSSGRGSLTDADLFNLFPHEGVPGVSVTYGGFTIQPPDYARCGTFRLTHSNGYLYATYQDGSGTYRCLTLDLRRMAWVPDVYTPAVSATYHPEQQAGTLASSSARYDELLYGLTTGAVAAQTPGTNDVGGAIACAFASFEYPGEDLRAPKQWGDFFADLLPAATAGVSLRPMSLGAGVAAPTVIPASAVRQRTPVSVGGIVVSDFMGILATWIDDYLFQSAQTQLFAWEPSFEIQPARAIGWTTFGSALGGPGFKSIPRIAVAWVSTAPVTISFAVTDGTAPASIVLPSSGGVFTKQYFTLTANKGQAYRYSAASAASFQLFLDSSEVYVAAWERVGAMELQRGFGVTGQDEGVV